MQVGHYILLSWICFSTQGCHSISLIICVQYHNKLNYKIETKPGVLINITKIFLICTHLIRFQMVNFFLSHAMLVTIVSLMWCWPDMQQSDLRMS